MIRISMIPEAERLFFFFFKIEGKKDEDAFVNFKRDPLGKSVQDSFIVLFFANLLTIPHNDLLQSV
jgi:hypothetical protein